MAPAVDTTIRNLGPCLHDSPLALNTIRGDRIGNFGGIDTDAVCRLSKPEMRDYITDVVQKSVGHGGFAFGSGNSIPDYVPPEGFLAMNEIIRSLRGE